MELFMVADQVACYRRSDIGSHGIGIVHNHHDCPQPFPFRRYMADRGLYDDRRLLHDTGDDISGAYTVRSVQAQQHPAAVTFPNRDHPLPVRTEAPFRGL